VFLLDLLVRRVRMFDRKRTARPAVASIALAPSRVSVVLPAKSTGKQAAYDGRYSLDPKTWTSLSQTLIAMVQ
jgi:hypothetical protein